MHDSREAHDRFARGRERTINMGAGDTVVENKDRGKGKRKTVRETRLQKEVRNERSTRTVTLHGK